MSTDLRDDPPPERSFWALVPWRNFRRVLFLILALGAVLAVKRSGGGFFGAVIESVGPPPPTTTTTPTREPAPRPVQTTVHLQAGPAGR